MKIKDLLNQRRVVESEIAELQRELAALDVLIDRQHKREGLTPSTADSAPTRFPLHSSNGNQEKHRRIRGTLKAAKQAVASFRGPFTRSELLEQIERLNPALAGKVRIDALRLTMRRLITENYMVPTELVSADSGEALYTNEVKRS